MMDFLAQLGVFRKKMELIIEHMMENGKLILFDKDNMPEYTFYEAEGNEEFRVPKIGKISSITLTPYGTLAMIGDKNNHISMSDLETDDLVCLADTIVNS